MRRARLLKGTRRLNMELFFHHNEQNWYGGCSLVPPSLFFVFLRGALTTAIVHIGFLKQKQHDVTYYCYVLMEFAHHYLYQWFRGCEFIQPALLTIMILDALLYTMATSMIRHQRNIIGYYSLVVLALIGFYTNETYDTFRVAIIISLCSYVLEHTLLKSNHDKEHLVEQRVERVEQPAVEPAEEEEDDREEGQLEDHVEAHPILPMFFPGEG